jgi:hypothetical protein
MLAYSLARILTDESSLFSELRGIRNLNRPKNINSCGPDELFLNGSRTVANSGPGTDSYFILMRLQTSFGV